MITHVTSKVDLPNAPNRRSQPDVLPTNTRVTERTHGSDLNPASPTHRVALEQAVGKVREALQQSGSQLQIEVDQDLHRVIVKIVKGDSGEVIRQIPPQEVIDLAKDLANHKGLLFEEHV
ncbi:MAG: flagellar protein FlaG [Nitrospira sp.]|nr:flagellar protein FlaG [Nitrospira sp.]